MRIRVRRAGRLACAASLALAATPLAAQGGSVPAAPAPQTPGLPTIDPNAPLAELPGIGVDWPDLPVEPAVVQAADTDVTAERRYSWRIEGIDAVAFDTGASIADGSWLLIPARVMVDEDDLSRAKRLLDPA